MRLPWRRRPVLEECAPSLPPAQTIYENVRDRLLTSYVLNDSLKRTFTCTFVLFAYGAFALLRLEARRTRRRRLAERRFYQLSTPGLIQTRMLPPPDSFVWDTPFDFWSGVAGSIVHEGWFSVRTPDELSSAVVTALVPLTPGRRAALCVWQSAISAALAATVGELYRKSTGPGAAQHPVHPSLLAAVALLLVAAAAQRLAAARRHLRPLRWFEDPQSDARIYEAAVAEAASPGSTSKSSYTLSSTAWSHPLRLASHSPRRLFSSVAHACDGLLAAKRFVDVMALRAAAAVPPVPNGAPCDGPSTAAAEAERAMAQPPDRWTSSLRATAANPAHLHDDCLRPRSR